MPPAQPPWPCLRRQTPTLKLASRGAPPAAPRAPGAPDFWLPFVVGEFSPLFQGRDVQRALASDLAVECLLPGTAWIDAHKSTITAEGWECPVVGRRGSHVVMGVVREGFSEQWVGVDQAKKGGRST